MSYTKQQIAAALDLAVLKPTATCHEVAAAARLVQREDIASICVAPCNVKLAKRYTDRVCAVIGFPHGNTTREVKQYEARQAIDHGAIELDVVCNYGRFINGKNPVDWLGIDVGYAHDRGVLVKAILEISCLTLPEIINLSEVCIRERVDFLKTSTGFAPGGATPEAVRAMVKVAAGRVGVKASGGIKSHADAALYLDLGCARLGSSCYWELLP